MKKKLLVFSSIIVCLLAIVLIVSNFDGSERIIFENNEESKQLMNTNALTMMYETEVGSGEYQVSSDTTWPQDGYVFNETLSKCENGGTLFWNSETKRVVLQTNSSDKCYMYFDAYVDPTLADVCDGKTFAECITTQVYTGTDGDNGLYYHDGLGSYTNADQEAGDNSYRYAGGDYQLTSKSTAAGYVAVFKPDYGGLDGVIIFHCEDGEYGCSLPNAKSYTLAYNETTEYSTYQDALETAVSDGYLTKDNIKNYVCFGSNEETCPIDNLYRVIGVFNNQVKLIKATSYGNYAYDVEDSSMWDASTKPDIYTTLNETYYNSLGSEWQNLIVETTWQVGGIDFSYATEIPKTAYDYEVGINQTGYEEIMKIGLMYVSDYGYAASPKKWIMRTSSVYYGYDNWLYLGSYERTIPRVGIGPSGGETMFHWAVCIDNFEDSGSTSTCRAEESRSIRPSFYLEYSVQLTGGTGIQSDPFRLSMN